MKYNLKSTTVFFSAITAKQEKEKKKNCLWLRFQQQDKVITGELCKNRNVLCCCVHQPLDYFFVWYHVKRLCTSGYSIWSNFFLLQFPNAKVQTSCKLLTVRKQEVFVSKWKADVSDGVILFSALKAIRMGEIKHVEFWYLPLFLFLSSMFLSSLAMERTKHDN